MKYKPNQKQRIEESMERNSFMDIAPSKLCYGYTQETVLNLRPDDKKKEIDGPFRYTAKSNCEKIIDAFRYNLNPMTSLSNKEAISQHLVHKGMFKNNIDLY